MRQVVLVTYYWPPSGGSGVQRWVYFAHFLNRERFSLTVITVDPKVASYKFTDDSFVKLVNDIRVIKTGTWEPFNLYRIVAGKKSKEEAIPQGFAGDASPGLADRISRFVRGNLFIPDARRGWNHFAEKALRQLFHSEKVDIVITTGPPQSTHLIGLRMKERFKFKWIADFRDPWAEVYYNPFMYKTKLASLYDGYLEKKVLNGADKVLTIGPGMAELLRQKVSPLRKNEVHYILNGYDAARFNGLEKEVHPAYFVICHLGVLSEHQPVDAFVEGLQVAIRELGSYPRTIILRLIGKVSPAIIQVVNQLSPGVQIEVMGYLPHKEALQQMVNADLLLNSLAEAGETSGLLISGKLMEYIASGNPVLCLGSESGDAAMILKEAGSGFVFGRDNIAGISAFLIQVLTNNFHFERKNVERYSREMTTNQLEQLLAAI